MKWVLPVILFLLSATCQAQSGAIQCTVIIDTVGYMPLQNIQVLVYEKDVLKISGRSDEDGIAYIKPIAPGRYNVSVIFPGRDTTHITGVLVKPDETTAIKASLQQTGQTIPYKHPLIDKYAARTSIELIEKMPERPMDIYYQRRPNVHIKTVKRFGKAANVHIWIKRVDNTEEGKLVMGQIYPSGECITYLDQDTYYVYVMSMTCAKKKDAFKRYRLEVDSRPVKRTFRVRECRK